MLLVGCINIQQWSFGIISFKLNFNMKHQKLNFLEIGIDLQKPGSRYFKKREK